MFLGDESEYKHKMYYQMQKYEGLKIVFFNVATDSIKRSVLYKQNKVCREFISFIKYETIL